MKFFKRPQIRMERIFKWLSILGIILGVGICGYLGVKAWKAYPEIFQRLPAAIFKSTEEEPTAGEIVQESPEVPKTEEKKYIEVAEFGEGITHLARRALKKYLQEPPQSFKVTPEHKIYIEDYITKKKGGGWLKLGEKLEISEDLIKEAMEKSESLSLEQLKNLEQYSQLAPSLN